MNVVLDSIVLELTNLGMDLIEADQKANEFYLGVIKDYTAHVQKHLDAALIANPEKTAEGAFLSDVLIAVKDDNNLLTQVVSEKIADSPVIPEEEVIV